MIPYGRQSIDAADIQAVVDVLRSDYLTQGPVVPAFEEAVTRYCGAGHAIAVNSATSALHIACLSLDIGPGDIVWTSPITFVASANCALYCGANVDFVDIDPRTYNLSIASLERKLRQARTDGTLPKAVVAVHLAGQSCDMAGMHALGREYGFKIIEDASHAIGGRYQGSAIGSCRYSDITVFSFHPVKIITTGEGGMALTNDSRLAKRMRLLRSHGITRDVADMTQEPDGPWYYQQLVLGFNYRMTDMQAALGLSQMSHLDEFCVQRHVIAKRYDALLAGLPIRLPWQHPDTVSGTHLYVIRLNPNESSQTHHQAFDTLRRSGIGVNLHYIPVYRQPYFKRMGFVAANFPEAERYYAEALSLPIFPRLSEADQQRVCESLAEAIGGR
jgi:UDP-4-amino-4,6-dideoxy-N-acetyl-beta-L-altrosamine transaminase